MLKRKAIVQIVISITLLIIFPVSALASQNTVDYLEFNNIEKQVLTRSQTVLNNSSDYGDLVFLNDIGSYGDRALFEAAIGTEMKNYLVVWSAQKNFIAYNTYTQSLEDTLAKKTLLEKKLQAVQLQEKLGMATANTVIETEKELQEVEIGIAQMQEAIDSYKESMNTLLGQVYNHPIVIGEVPEVSAETIAAINPDQDYKKALALAYQVKLESKEKRKEDEERKFESSFYRSYQNILDQKTNLDLEIKKLEIAENNHKTSVLKYSLGMMSSLQFQAQYSSYVSQKIAVEKAKDQLARAYKAYQWAMRGIIVG